MSGNPIVEVPVKVALIGAGQRARTIYRPLMPSMGSWMNVVAVCDPVREHADSLAASYGVPAFYDIRELVRARPMEAAVVVTPVESHHSISCFLSANDVHNLVETSWCSTVTQARQMIAAARNSGVIVRVAENYFRFPIDRIVASLSAAGSVGPIRRIVSYADHTGYHNNSRWIAFFGAHPEWVQSIEHTMPTMEFNESPERFHNDETYRARFFQFPGNSLVVDHLANVKGFLGRYPRPGYTEWQGERGTIVHFARRGWQGEGEIRLCTDSDFGKRGISDVVIPIVTEYADRRWTRTYADLSACGGELVEYENPFRPEEIPQHASDWYGCAVMDHLADFAGAVRGVRASEFDEDDALMSMMMEVGAKESALREGARVRLPMEGEPESEQRIHARLRQQFGVDPLDIEGMLAISYPKP